MDQTSTKQVSPEPLKSEQDSGLNALLSDALDSASAEYQRLASATELFVAEARLSVQSIILALGLAVLCGGIALAAWGLVMVALAVELAAVGFPISVVLLSLALLHVVALFVAAHCVRRVSSSIGFSRPGKNKGARNDFELEKT